MINDLQPNDETLLPAASTSGLGELRFLHPPGTFALTPASMISSRAVAAHQNLLRGIGIDWGSGAGCLAIAAARIAAVDRVIGLEIVPANAAIAHENALLNGVGDKVSFFVSDSYSPIAGPDLIALDTFSGRTEFILANPPASEGDDGFGFRRIVLAGARKYLADGGVVFLSISSQYGECRISRLCDDVSEFEHGGVLASTDWMPFDLARCDLLECLRQYANEESRGGIDYVFRSAETGDATAVNARDALARYQENGQSPFMKWQSHLFRFR